MANDTTTTLSALFKIVQDNYLGNDIPRASGPTAALIRDKAKTRMAGGRNLDTTWAHKSYDGVGMGTLSEGGDFPATASSLGKNFTLALTHQAYAVGVTGHAQAMGTSSKASWLRKSLVAEKTEELKQKVGSIRGRFLMNDGTPIFARVSVVSGGADGYITISTGSIHMFRKGETITVRDAASSGSEQLTGGAGSGLIKDIDYQNGRLYCADVTGAAASDYIALSGFYDTTVPNGLRNIVAATGTIQGLVRTTVGNFLAQANVKSVSGAIQSSTVDEIRDLVKEIGGERDDPYTSTWIANYKTRRWATDATIGQNRFTDLALTLGVSEVMLNDKSGKRPLMEDPYLRDAEMFVIDPSQFVTIAPEGMEGGEFVTNADGSVLFQQTAASGAGYADAKLMYYVDRWNIGCDNFRVQAYASGFSAP